MRALYSIAAILALVRSAVQFANTSLVVEDEPPLSLMGSNFFDMELDDDMTTTIKFGG